MLIIRLKKRKYFKVLHPEKNLSTLKFTLCDNFLFYFIVNVVILLFDSLSAGGQLIHQLFADLSLLYSPTKHNIYHFILKTIYSILTFTVTISNIHCHIYEIEKFNTLLHKAETTENKSLYFNWE